MARKFSTGLRNAILGKRPSKTAGTWSFTSATNTIADSGNGLTIFAPADVVYVSGSASNDGFKILASVATTGASMISTSSITTESSTASITVSLANSRSFGDALRYGVIDIYSGSQPADADTAESGTKLVRITAGSGAFSAGYTTNGLELGTPADGVVNKTTASWSGVGLVTGTAGWFRYYNNLAITGASTTAIRLDGSVGVSGAQLNISSTSIVAGATTTADTCEITLGA